MTNVEEDEFGMIDLLSELERIFNPRKQNSQKASKK